jgi:hypothetical protein
MAPIIRAEPNGCQALLMFDGAYSDLEKFGWLPFIKKFDGYNPIMARQFARQLMNSFLARQPACLLRDRSGPKVAR